MKQIKYRAFIKSENKIVNVSSIHLGSKKIVYGYSNNSQSYGNKSCKFEDCRLMQYIGLNDINNIEIYEGDIVEMHYFFEDYDRTSFGAFENETKVVGVVGIDTIGTFCKNKTKKYYFLDYLQEPSEELEVIGNIYDNKELLGE